MKTLLISLIAILCTLVWSGFSLFDDHDNDNSDLTWEDIDEELWP